MWSEVARNRTKDVYDPNKANHKAYVRRKYAKYQGKKIVENRVLRMFVEKQLLAGQSPEAISGRLKAGYEKEVPYASKDSIYRYLKSVHGRKIEVKITKRKKRTKKRGSKGILDGRTFIDKRPVYINDRTRVGDAEFDFIVSGKSGRGIVLVVVDRKLRISFLEPIYQVSIPAVHAAAARIKQRYPEWKTGTTDNDLLFARHKELERELGIRIFFCHAYHSWEKGTVENINGEIRQDFPKGSDVSKYSRRFFQRIEKRMNDRFMKCLKYRTPAEALKGCRDMKKLRSHRSGRRKRGHSI